MIALIFFVLTHISLTNAYQLNNAIKEMFFEENFPVDCSYPDGLNMTFNEIVKPH